MVLVSLTGTTIKIATRLVLVNVFHAATPDMPVSSVHAQSGDAIEYPRYGVLVGPERQSSHFETRSRVRCIKVHCGASGLKTSRRAARNPMGGRWMAVLCLDQDWLKAVLSELGRASAKESDIGLQPMCWALLRGGRERPDEDRTRGGSSSGSSHISRDNAQYGQRLLRIILPNVSSLLTHDTWMAETCLSAGRQRNLEASCDDVVTGDLAQHWL